MEKKIIQHTRIPDAFMALAKNPTELAVLWAIAHRYDRKARVLKAGNVVLGNDVFLSEQRIKQIFKNWLVPSGIVVLLKRGNQFQEKANKYDVPELRKYYDETGMPSYNEEKDTVEATGSAAPSTQVKAKPSKSPSKSKGFIAPREGAKEFYDLWKNLFPESEQEWKRNTIEVIHTLMDRFGTETADFLKWFSGMCEEEHLNPRLMSYIKVSHFEEFLSWKAVQAETAKEKEEARVFMEEQAKQPIIRKPDLGNGDSIYLNKVQRAIIDAGLWQAFRTELQTTITTAAQQDPEVSPWFNPSTLNEIVMSWGDNKACKSTIENYVNRVTVAA